MSNGRIARRRAPSKRGGTGQPRAVLVAVPQPEAGDELAARVEAASLASSRAFREYTPEAYEAAAVAWEQCGRSETARSYRQMAESVRGAARRLERAEEAGEGDAVRARERERFEDRRRRDLVSALTDACDAATGLQEAELVGLLHALRDRVARGERGILAGDDDTTKRVRTWARSAADRPTIFLRVGMAPAVVRERLRNGRKPATRAELPGVVDLMLQLPWEDDAVGCASASVRLYLDAGLRTMRPLASWEIEAAVVSEVTEGSWRNRGAITRITRDGYARAVLRGLGFAPKVADQRVRDVLERLREFGE